MVPQLEPPEQTIRTDHDVDAWRNTRSFQDYAVFLRRLNEAVVGCYLPWDTSNSSPVRSVVHLHGD